jgi:hypothetical protein
MWISNIIDGNFFKLVTQSHTCMKLLLLNISLMNQFSELFFVCLKTKFTWRYFKKANFIFLHSSIIYANNDFISNLDRVFLYDRNNYQTNAFFQQRTKKLAILLAPALPNPITTLILFVTILKLFLLHFL